MLAKIPRNESLKGIYFNNLHGETIEYRATDAQYCLCLMSKNFASPKQTWQTNTRGPRFESLRMLIYRLGKFLFHFITFGDKEDRDL